MTLFELEALLTLDAGQFNSGVNNAKRQSKTFAQTIGADADSIKAAFTNAFSFSVGQLMADGFKQAIGAAWDFAGESVQVASDVQTANRKIDKVFGDSAEAVKTWATDEAAAYGLSESAALRYTAQIGSLLGAQELSEEQMAEMSTGLVGLAGDLATFNGISFETAWQKILSGMRGETEAIEDMGIDVRAAALAASLGISESDWGALSQTERTIATYNHILASAEDARGFFAENQDTYAAQMMIFNSNIEQLKASLGDSLLPVMTDLVSWFNSLFDTEQDASVMMGDFGDTILESFVSIDTTTQNALDLVKALKELSAAGEDASSTEMWDAILDELEDTIPGIGTLIAENKDVIYGGAEALEQYVLSWQKASREMAITNAFAEAQNEINAQAMKVARLETRVNVAGLSAEEVASRQADWVAEGRAYLGLSDTYDIIATLSKLSQAEKKGDLYAAYILDRYDELGSAGKDYAILQSELKAEQARLAEMEREYAQLKSSVEALTQQAKPEAESVPGFQGISVAVDKATAIAAEVAAAVEAMKNNTPGTITLQVYVGDEQVAENVFDLLRQKTGDTLVSR